MREARLKTIVLPGVLSGNGITRPDGEREALRSTVAGGKSAEFPKGSVSAVLCASMSNNRTSRERLYIHVRSLETVVRCLLLDKLAPAPVATG